MYKRQAVGGVKGEITIVVAGASPAAPAALGEVVTGIQERVAAGERLKDVCAAEAARTGLSRKVLYDAVVAQRR